MKWVFWFGEHDAVALERCLPSHNCSRAPDDSIKDIRLMIAICARLCCRPTIEMPFETKTIPPNATDKG